MLDWLSRSPIAWALGGQSFELEIRAALIDALATLMAAVAGFGAVIWQMRSQGKLARDAIIETEKRKFKADMYQRAEIVCRELADTTIELATNLRTMAMYVEVGSRAAAAGLGCPTPPTRIENIMTHYTAFSDSVLKFIFLIENRRFIDQRILVFRSAMSAILHETRELIFQEFPLSVWPILPVESPDGSLYPYKPPPIETALAAGVLAKTVIDQLDDAVAYTEDFLVEMQNLLLSDLFGTKVSERQPIDPARKVLSLARSDHLESWFRRESKWGQNCQHVEDELRAQFAREAGG